MSKAPIGTELMTRHECPASGVWKTKTAPNTTIPLSEGETAPPYGGKAVIWILIQYA